MNNVGTSMSFLAKLKRIAAMESGSIPVSGADVGVPAFGSGAAGHGGGKDDRSVKRQIDRKLHRRFSCMVPE